MSQLRGNGQASGSGVGRSVGSRLGGGSSKLVEAANDSAILGAGGVSTGMINISTPLDVCEIAAERGGVISVKGSTAIRTLAYLDYRLVNVDAVVKARELYGEDLAKLEQDVCISTHSFYISLYLSISIYIYYSSFPSPPISPFFILLLLTSIYSYLSIHLFYSGCKC